MAMTPEEQAALRSLQDDLFRARTELAFERRCIDEAMSHLSTSTKWFTTPNDEKAVIHGLASIIDAARSELNRRMGS